ncbi:carbohydrate sulfotransferase 8 [Ixodes scapularis]|uniref:carbohydrate sulfotransferase 8 n=1 Tax=Ixodes scapularis TaxID=6945 RepID=UPI0011252FEE|nr:carbohydrate sulfotransferase 8 [Ixodes scapularis]
MKRKAACLLVAVFCFSAAAWLRRSPWQRHLVPPSPDAEENAVTKVTEAAVDDLESRLARIRETCLKHKRALLGAHYLGTRSNRRLGRPSHCPPRRCPIFVDRSHRVAFCFVPKVASTSVKSLFAALLNISRPADSADAIHEIFNAEVLRVGPSHFPRSKLKTYTRAVFVRHPFERLVSAFVDKAGRPRSAEPFFYDVYWDRALAGLAGNETTGVRMTFPLFVDYILAQPDALWDDHWAPYYSRCEPCLFDYNVVGKLETGDRDFRTLFSRMGLASGDVVPRKNTRTVGDAGEKGGARKSAKEYFAELSSSQVMQLYRRYFYDFELFGYNLKGYLH